MNRLFKSLPAGRVRLFVLLGVVIALMALAGVVYANIPDRLPPRGAVPNPGTQEQELANITFPAPYNTFEFVVTCAACHGGSVDQQVGHFGNWAGSAMGSAARDPIFRANQQIVNQTVLDLTGVDGGGNICIRCHSPNAWYSGRTDPFLAGEGDASNMIHSIVLSTDDEGILCEFCHRTMGGVMMKRADLPADDPAWNMMAGLTDWPHAGEPYPDGPVAGNPYGDNTMQINDGMTYAGKYPGVAEVWFSDTPITGTYTGQTYGVWPDGTIVVAPDGSTPIHFEVPIGPPIDPDTGLPDYYAQAFSPEHTTVDGAFVKSSEFCGSCHDLTIPVLNHGMPEQRTYTEWKYSDFGAGNVRCQDCHMPSMTHEYADDAPVGVNADPTLSGWFPYAKDRNPQGGTAFHKFGGANVDLPEMMKVLYPEVDLEVIGAPTGNDTRIFPGMLSNRDSMYDRAQRNSEITLRDAVNVQISQAPVEISAGVYEMKVKVTNTSGHKIPSGYPDGRRFWIGVQALDGANVVYESGAYDAAQAVLHNSAGDSTFTRAQEPVIDATVQNAVMVYEKVTATCVLDANRNPLSCGEPSPNLLNNTVYFDNRIPPSGFDLAQYNAAGAKFVNFDAVTGLPYRDDDRYPAGQGFDEVTYIFNAAPGLSLTVKADVYWQTHTREFMEHLRTSNGSTYRPEGPPNILDPNYPLTPTYLSDHIENFDTLTALDGSALRDNWGGVAYAAWLTTGKGAPYLVDSAETGDAALPAPTGLAATTIDPFTAHITWDPVTGADGYTVWIRYGAGDTLDWDRLAVVYDATELVNTAMNVAKTYAFKVQAFNGAGGGAESAPVVMTTPIDLPLPPENLKVVSTTAASVTLSWFDAADNEIGFIIERQDVPALGNFYEVARIPSQTEGGATGGNTWTDTSVLSGMTYNYRVASYNASGASTWTIPVSATTGGVPGSPTNLTATAISGSQVDLAWGLPTGTITGYKIERSSGSPTGPWTTTFVLPVPNATSFSDTTVVPNTTYWYRVSAYNSAGTSAPSNVAEVRTPDLPPADPTGLAATVVTGPQVNLTWTDNATNEQGYYVERSGDGVNFTRIATLGVNASAYSDATVQVQTTYYYRVQAFNSGGVSVSGYSNVVTVVVPAEKPQAPSELRVTRVTFNTITMSWRDNSTAEQGFYVYMSTDGVTFTRVATLAPNTTTYKATGLSRRTTYWFYITAFNAAGESEPSETVSARTR